MAGHRRLRKALKGHGLKLVGIGAWFGRGRPRSTGGFAPVGVLCHHTGSSGGGRSYAEWMAKVGRSDLPAPLVQLGLDRDGTVYLCASGRSNHAGDAKASGPIRGGDGNELYIGIEAMNDGSEGWTKKQYRAYVKVCAALCVYYKWPASHVRAHKETSTTGKWDPGKLDMGKFRQDVGAEINRMRAPKPKGPRINMDHLQAAWGRKGGRTFNPWGMLACRRWRKTLGKRFMPGTKYNWTQGWFGRYLRDGTRRANKAYDITKYAGKDGSRPNWELAKKLGARPYRVKKR